MGSSTENSRVRPDSQPVGHHRIPGGSGGGRRRRWRPVRHHWPSAPTPADRSASPRRSRHSSASSPRTERSRGTALSRWPRRWTRSGPCAPHGRSTRRCCTRSSPGYDPRDSTLHRRARAPVVGRAQAPTYRGMRIGLVKGAAGDGYQPGVRRASTESQLGSLEDARRRGRRGLLPELRVRVGRLLLDPAQ